MDAEKRIRLAAELAERLGTPRTQEAFDYKAWRDAGSPGDETPFTRKWVYDDAVMAERTPFYAFVDSDGRRSIAHRTFAEIVEALDEMGVLIDTDEKHLIDLRDCVWTIQHPAWCRAQGALFDCDYTRLAGETRLDVYLDGRYEAFIDPGEDTLHLTAREKN